MRSGEACSPRFGAAALKTRPKATEIKVTFVRGGVPGRVGRREGGARPPVSPHQSSQQAGRAARARLAHCSEVPFPALCNGHGRSSPVPRAKHPEGGHGYYPHVQMGKLRPERGSLQPVSPPWARGGATPAGPSLPRPRAPQAPSPRPRQWVWRRQSRAAGQQGWRRAGGGHPQEAALFLELRFKETQDAKLSPSHCGRCHHHSLAHSRGWGRNAWARGPAPSWTSRSVPCGPC